MTLALPNNVLRLWPKKRKDTPPPAQMAPRPKTAYEQAIEAHYNLPNDGLQLIRHLPDMDRLIDILSLNRCAKGPGITYLLAKYLTESFEVDEYGNRFLSIPQVDGSEPRIAFTSHCDTVSDDTESLYHPLKYNKARDILFRTDGNCLGADDGTGIWIMLNMIDAKVPGLYCFFLDEETGRQGSEWSWANDTYRYDFIDTVISFDRKDTKDIIGRQRGTRCCSDEFQTALAQVLSSEAYGISFKINALGSFTDSATFMDDLAECTNISVGYDKQHSAQETQLVHFASDLMRTLQLVGHLFHDKLPVVRDPDDDIRQPPQWAGYGGYDRYGSYANYYQSSSKYEAERKAMANAASPPYDPNEVTEDDDDSKSWIYEDVASFMNETEFLTLKHGTLAELMELFPDAISALIEDMGWTEDEVAEYVANTLFGVEDIRDSDPDITH
jgi:hypothetical protein